MIRFNVAYCPCCLMRLKYNGLGDYFWCGCEGWSHLKWSDRQKEIESAERFDARALNKRAEEILDEFKTR